MKKELTAAQRSWTIGKPFVPKDEADSTVMNLPPDKRREHFNGRFRALLDGATHTAPNLGPPSLSGSENEPKKKE
jgi:hypothetical protein